MLPGFPLGTLLQLSSPTEVFMVGQKQKLQQFSLNYRDSNLHGTAMIIGTCEGAEMGDIICSEIFTLRMRDKLDWDGIEMSTIITNDQRSISSTSPCE